ncbi:hypothetical protein niasHT_025202 [Heterodera trifolii]|uniref:Ubiquitin-like domain-containing protein n=1 Tax=Heterodera trifolii TaxID=157864 RepID=A0ABD2JLD3_9BILA
MSHFGVSLCSVGISAGLMAMLFMLMIMPSSTGGFRIYVSLPVEVEDTDTVATLKQKIEKITKIPPKEQTIRSKDIPNGHMLVTTNGTETVQNFMKKIKPRIDEDLNCLSGPIKLRRHTTSGTVEFRDNETLDECGINGDKGINVNKNATVATLKRKIENIQEIGHIPAERQILRCDSDGRLLNHSNKALEHYGIGQGSYIVLSWDEFQIWVQYKGEKHAFVVKHEDTVQILKEKIKQIIDILPEKQVLSRDQDGIHFSNKKTIENCGIVKDDTIFLSLDFNISVSDNWLGGASLYFKVSGTDTVQSLNDRIREKKRAEWYFPNGKIKLRKMYGSELENNETLEHYGIGPGADLYL